MREIKFRAWDEETRRMLSWDGLNGETEYGDAYTVSELVSFGSHLMQYTGLKDKNGKEIWEGDIVQWMRVEPVEKRHELALSTPVTFSKAGFVPFTDPSYDVSPEEVEVIGNIYESPELLKSSHAQ